MMTSLFSSFDPVSSLSLITNWASSLIFILLVMAPFWLVPNRVSLIINQIMTTLHLEFKTLLGPQAMSGSTLLMICLFVMIVFNNFLGLYPYIFTSTSHLVLTLSLSLPLWLSFMMYGWLNHTKHMFSHLVPQSTPAILMPFMVLIESISNIIRPGTLAVRLAANMIAGHLLMTLLGNQTASVGMYLVPMLLVTQVLLLTLEAAVSIIQSYVFAVLSTLYASEVIAH